MTTPTADSTPATQETDAEWDERVNGPRRRAARDQMDREDWEPTYEKWRHGGSYVTNLIYPSGAIGCIASARHTASGKFEIACHHDAGTFPTRRAAAFAEREIAQQMWRDHTSEARPMREHQFSWLGNPPEDDEDQTFTAADAPYVSISGPHSANGWWDVTMNNVPGYDDGMTRDDDTGSAWSTVAMVMCEHGATPDETDALAAAAPKCLRWCFDGQVGMYAVHEDELWED